MGSSLAPVLANIFMGFYEPKWLNEYNFNKHKFYLKYVDFKTRIEEHIKKDNKSHIVKHLSSTTTCFDSYNSLSFKISDKVNSTSKLKKLYILIGEKLT